MKLSRKADYALRVLMTLVARKGEGEANGNGQGPLSMNELAKANDVPKRFLEHIMLDLKEQGWVASTAGRKGGYVLSADPARITMGQVIRHFDGLMAPIGCVSVTRFEPCSQSSTCHFRRVLMEVRNATANYLDNTTLAKVVQLAPVPDQEVFSLTFTAGDGI
jgi:Rrf2 family protein